jgi:putative endonuclease
MQDDVSSLMFALAHKAQKRAQRLRRQRLARASAAAAAPDDDPPRLSRTQERGADYEERALDLLMREGLQPLARNLRCKVGEIDLVMREGDVLVIVEVRARAPHGFGGAAASVGRHKQARLLRAAACVLPGLARRHFQGREPAVRIDVVAFDGDTPSWLPNAFGLPWPQC